MNVDAASSDVIRLVLQFLQEHNLMRTFYCLQEESRVTLNSVESIQQFVDNIEQGRWEQVLRTVSMMSLPEELLENLYEHVVLELLDLQEREIAQRLLRETVALQSLKLTHPHRIKRLEQLCAKQICDTKELFIDIPKLKRRTNLVEAMVQGLDEVPNSRLLATANLAMRYLCNQGIMSPGDRFDLFKGTVVYKAQHQERYVQQIAKTISFGTKGYATCGVFSPNGDMFATGSSDGFIEIWDPYSGRLKSDLEYQKTEPMVESSSILSIRFSRGNQYLLTGNAEGGIKLWEVETGKLIRSMTKAHSNGVTSVSLSYDGAHILSSSLDHTAKIHHVKMSTTQKTFRGHTSFVNSAEFNNDGSMVVTSSNDGYVIVWETKTATVLRKFHVPTAQSDSNEETEILYPIISATPFLKTGTEEAILVCPRAPVAFVMSFNGSILKSFPSGKDKEGDYVGVALSADKTWCYALAEDCTIYIFQYHAASLESIIKAHSKEPIGIAHHPQHTLLATYASDSKILLLTPQ